ncbi:hypothetical protein MG293_002181 [Ovis ammon polii]|uniref:Uncharacterized protein n=1 Tax=Ovis ammon polii TaxID=230172 RepID=A0AAD4YJJ8_OVIAM|nr:hypothetical protein MG293_002181 [Ovis ammon polii]
MNAHRNYTGWSNVVTDLESGRGRQRVSQQKDVRTEAEARAMQPLVWKMEEATSKDEQREDQRHLTTHPKVQSWEDATLIELRSTQSQWEEADLLTALELGDPLLGPGEQMHYLFSKKTGYDIGPVSPPPNSLHSKIEGRNQKEEEENRFLLGNELWPIAWKNRDEWSIHTSLGDGEATGVIAKGAWMHKTYCCPRLALPHRKSAAAAMAQERLRGATPRPRSGVVVKRIYPMSKFAPVYLCPVSELRNLAEQRVSAGCIWVMGLETDV